MATSMATSIEILHEAIDAQNDRAASRDTPEGERSMKRCVAAFNALEGTQLTEAQGWRFMAVLKLARATAGAFNVDDYVDGASYFSLAGEASAQKANAARAEDFVDTWEREEIPGHGAIRARQACQK